MSLSSEKQKELHDKIKANKDILKERPCYKCLYHIKTATTYFGNNCSKCNFSHDRFMPISGGEVHPKSEQV